MFLLLVAMLTVIVFILFPPLIQERSHWILLVGVSVWITQYDINYIISMNLP